MNRRVILVISLLMAVPLLYSIAFASTSAELSRSSNINVDTDAQGIIALTPNPDYDIIQVNETFSIDPQNVGANSMNTNATLTLGNTQDPSQTEAFTVQNRQTEPITISISLEPANQYTSSAGSVTYYIDKGNSLTQISVGNTDTVQLSAGEEIYVAVEIQSTESSGDLTTNLVISGDSQ